MFRCFISGLPELKGFNRLPLILDFFNEVNCCFNCQALEESKLF